LTIGIAAAEPDDLFFPDALSSSNPSSSTDSDMDTLTEEMLGDLLHDAETPYRPNVASYDQTETVSAYSRDQASSANAVEPDAKSKSSSPPPPHTSASSSSSIPAFQSLAIFTGQDERFAFERAVSRIHEMCSPEYVRSARWQPLAETARSWERSPEPANNSLSTTPVLEDGRQESLDDEESRQRPQVLRPQDIRVKYPDGVPEYQELDDAEAEASSERRSKGGRFGKQEGRPVIQSHHVWGIADWGKKAGRWGEGARAYEKEKPKSEDSDR
jgi:protein AFG1